MVSIKHYHFYKNLISV